MPINEQTTVQIPALLQLALLGWDIIPFSQIPKSDKPYIEEDFRASLFKLNPTITDTLYEKLILKLKPAQAGGLVEINKQFYLQLKNGITIDHHLDGKLYSETFQLIDWGNIHNNKMFIVPEYEYKNARFDMVVFVNGLPLAIIECKMSNLSNGIDQLNRYHEHEDFFQFNQLNFVFTGAFAKYGTTSTSEAFYSVWRESSSADQKYFTWDHLPNLSQIFAGRLENFQNDINPKLSTNTETYTMIQSILLKERFFDIIQNFIVFDGTIKKTARYQQFALVQDALERIKKDNKGGLVWQTQGSGKSLLMVFLAQNIRRKIATNAIIVLVTDRNNLDKQLFGNFKSCGFNVCQATSSKKLKELLENHTPIIATVLHKFNYQDTDKQYIEDPCFIFVDEAHRSTAGDIYAKTESLFPNACFFGFTGTPVYKKDKHNTFDRFGSLLQPTYTIRDALKDKAIVPLIYEARFLDKKFNIEDLSKFYDSNKEIDNIDIASKYRILSTIKNLDEVIDKYASDIFQHYQENFRGSEDGICQAKAQLTVDSRIEALKYHRALQKLGLNTRLVISSGENDKKELTDFFKENGTLDITTITDIFKKEDNQIEMLIVVDMLITGFDAPINTVLYINRRLKDHTLLQAIARVNRNYKDKSHGFIIDYLGLLGEIKGTLNKYDKLSNFDSEDIEDTFFSISEIKTQLDTTQEKITNLFLEHNFDIISQFNDIDCIYYVKNNDPLRNDFYNLVTRYGDLLKACLSSKQFYQLQKMDSIENYKEFLKCIYLLRTNVKKSMNDTPQNSQDNVALLELLKRVDIGDVNPLNKPFDIISLIDKDDALPLPQEETKDAIISMMMRIESTKQHLEKNKESDPVLFKDLLKQINKMLADIKQERIVDIAIAKNIATAEDIITKFKEGMKSSTKYHDNLKRFLLEYDLKLATGTIDTIIIQIEKYISEKIEKTKYSKGIWKKNEKSYIVDIATIIEEYIPDIPIKDSEDIAKSLLKVVGA